METENDFKENYLAWAKHINISFSEMNKKTDKVINDMFKLQTMLYLLEKKLTSVEHIQNDILDGTIDLND